MADARIIALLEELRATRFADLRGARVTASIPISERLLDRLVAQALPPSAPVEAVTIRPIAGNRFRVGGRVKRAAFLPPMQVTLEIVEQPRLPDGPLVLQIRTFPGLMALAGGLAPLASKLPPGISLEKERIYVDVRRLLESQGAGDLVPHIESLRVTTDEGRLIADVALKVG